MNISNLVGFVKAVAPALGNILPGPVGNLLGQVLPKLGDIFQSSAPLTENSRSQMSLADQDKGVKAGGGNTAAPKQGGSGGFLQSIGSAITKAFPQAAPFVNAVSGLFGG